MKKSVIAASIPLALYVLYEFVEIYKQIKRFFAGDLFRYLLGSWISYGLDLYISLILIISVVFIVFALLFKMRRRMFLTTVAVCVAASVLHCIFKYMPIPLTYIGAIRPETGLSADLVWHYAFVMFIRVLIILAFYGAVLLTSLKRLKTVIPLFIMTCLPMTYITIECVDAIKFEIYQRTYSEGINYFYCISTAWQCVLQLAIIAVVVIGALHYAKSEDIPEEVTEQGPEWEAEREPVLDDEREPEFVTEQEPERETEQEQNEEAEQKPEEKAGHEPEHEPGSESVYNEV